MESVTLSLAHDSREGDQGAVWASVDTKMCELAVASNSSACTEISRVYNDELTDHIEALQLVPRQRGAIFSVADDFIGLELFDRVSTMKLLLPKLIRSYAIDSLSRRDNPARRMSMAHARRFLREVAGAELRSHRAVGYGQDIRLISEDVSGGGLSCDGVVVQLSAFRKRQEPRTRDFASTIPQVTQIRQHRSPFPEWDDES